MKDNAQLVGQSFIPASPLCSISSIQRCTQLKGVFMLVPSSKPYTVAGVLLHVNPPGASIEQAEKLEGQDVKKAFAMYESLAEESPKAAYRCGLMLLEGRGAKRNFWQAYGYLKIAAMQEHAEAKEAFSKIEKKMRWLCEIVTRLSEAGTNNDGTLKISPELQHGMKMLILSDKNERNIENTIITYQDITEAIDDITGYFQEDDSRKQALQCWLVEAANSFPLVKEDAIEVAPLIMTQKQQLVMVEKIMSFKDGAGKQDTEKWTITCHDITHVVFNNKERKCLTPVWLNDEKAEAYRQNLMGSLLAEGIASYNHREQARVVMVIQEYQLPPDIWQNLDKFLLMRTKLQLSATSQFHQGRKALQDAAWWQDKLQADVIVPRQAEPSLWNFFAPWKKFNEPEQPSAAKTFFLENPAKRKYCYLPLDTAGKEYLKKKGIDHPVLLKLIENGRPSLAGSIGFSKLTEYGAEAILDPQVQKWLGESSNLSHLSHIIKASRYFAQAVRNPWVREGITIEKLPVAQLTNLKWYRAKALLDPGVQKWLDESSNLSYLPYVIGIGIASKRASKAVRNQWVRDGITSGKLPVDQLTQITWEGADALIDPRVQKWLDESSNLSYLPYVIGISSDGFATLVGNQWVRDGITSGKLPVDQLTKLTEFRANKLLDPVVQKWLDESSNLSYRWYLR